MSYRKIALGVGFFIIISSILIVISLFYVMDKKGIFESRIVYTLIAKNAQDIEEGMPILFSGFEIGQVKKMRLNEKGEVLITISIPEHNTKWIRADSVFTLEKPLIGKAKITLTSSVNSRFINPKSIMRMRTDDGINELIGNVKPLTVQLESILKNVSIISSTLADSNSSFQASLSHIEKFSKQLSDSENLLHSLTGDKKSAPELRSAIKRLDLSIQEFRKLTQNTDEGISEIRTELIQPANTNLQDLDLILKDINNKLKEIDNTFKIIGQSDKDIVYLKDEMKVWLEEVTELSERINSIIGKEQRKEIRLP